MSIISTKRSSRYWLLTHQEWQVMSDCASFSTMRSQITFAKITSKYAAHITKTTLLPYTLIYYSITRHFHPN